MLALVARAVDLPANVRVETFGAKVRLRRGARLVGLLVPEFRRRPVAVLAHMSPVYAVVAAPVDTTAGRCRCSCGSRTGAHSRTLQLAERLATKILIVSDQSFPFPSRKVVASATASRSAGRPARRANDGVLRLLSLGRTSPAKGLETVVKPEQLVEGVPVEAEIRGPSLTGPRSCIGRSSGR